MSRSELLSRPPDLVLARRLNWLVVGLSITVLGLVAAMRVIRIPLPDGWSTDFLPSAYSTINAGVAVLLVVAWILIKRGHVRGHRAAIQTALVGSFIFLLGYVIYHVTADEQRFTGEGPIRFVYFSLLISHIVLAAVSFPLILYTWVLATTRQFARHRKFAQWVFPLWLYVALTGPLCWILLRTWG